MSRHVALPNLDQSARSNTAFALRVLSMRSAQELPAEAAQAAPFHPPNTLPGDGVATSVTKERLGSVVVQLSLIHI